MRHIDDAGTDLLFEDFGNTIFVKESRLGGL